MPRKPLPPLIRVDSPQRLRKGSKEHRRLGGFVVASPAWGSPFRPREIDSPWFVAWTGDDQELGQYKPDGWEDIPRESRLEAAQLALEAFLDWITSLLHNPACWITPGRSCEVTTSYVSALMIGPVMAIFCLSWRISNRCRDWIQTTIFPEKTGQSGPIVPRPAHTRLKRSLAHENIG